MSKASKRRASRGKPAPYPSGGSSAAQPAGGKTPAGNKQAGRTSPGHKASAQPPKKQRGGWLTAMLVVMIVHGIFTGVLLILLNKQPAGIQAPVLWGAAALVTLADIASAVLLWFWKRIGLYLYVVATFAGIAVGLVMLPSLLTAFHGIIPLGILGMILTSQRKLPLLE